MNRSSRWPHGLCRDSSILFRSPLLLLLTRNFKKSRIRAASNPYGKPGRARETEIKTRNYTGQNSYADRRALVWLPKLTGRLFRYNQTQLYSGRDALVNAKWQMPSAEFGISAMEILYLVDVGSRARSIRVSMPRMNNCCNHRPLAAQRSAVENFKDRQRRIQFQQLQGSSPIIKNYLLTAKFKSKGLAPQVQTLVLILLALCILAGPEVTVSCDFEFLNYVVNRCQIFVGQINFSSSQILQHARFLPVGKSDTSFTD